ncbi:MAG TPA: tyrosine-protein phosphatase [Planctomycetota bacterium]|nr:tyrosine-protein phosphatase [Planctomycetota bacterium]
MSAPAGADGSAAPASPASQGAADAAASPLPFWRRRTGRILRIALVALAVVILSLAGYFYCCGALGANFHEVSPAPNALYRSAQLSSADLLARVKALQVKTVLNLRGENPGKPWYDEEAAALRAAGVRQIDIKMSGKHMPTREKLAALIEALDTAPRPILVHCQWGSDRTGLACAIERLEHGNDFAAARGELAFFPYGHIRHFGYQSMDRVIDQFETYRQGGGALSLLAWAQQVYDPGADHDEVK